MTTEKTRPDLSGVPEDVVEYIHALEAELELKKPLRDKDGAEASEEPLEVHEPPTTMQVITISNYGACKRTPRHLYARQRRGGMGIFGMDLSGGETPVLLTVADINSKLLLITNLARAFHLAVNKLEELPIRARGIDIAGRFQLQPKERFAVAMQNPPAGYVVMVSEHGMVRRLRHHLFGEHMKAGTALFDTREFGDLAAACVTPGDGELFIGTKKGMGIRFAEKLIPPHGCAGIRLASGDQATGVCAVQENSGVFILGDDGRGSIRLMSGFAANKAPGAGGKITIKADNVIGAMTIREGDDIFAITRLAKIIRFDADEIPPKEAVVQGVNCITLRGDNCVAIAVSAV